MNSEKQVEEQLYFSNMRKNYIDVLRKDLIGPSEEHELIKERPNTFYLGGMLYPANIKVEDIDIQEFGTGEETEDKDNQVRDYDDANQEEIASNQNRFQPSSIGLSCNIKTSSGKS
ncbi:hypothetical protein NBRC111894_4239 [Sporolactobacillus inulinus]|uniref:Uncharacterized protein n=1 Tax=Sporolactobacillus inulinus TaxID=2078 RepID=A0A4Y1ZHT1_9BACL|nr:hypothetical protein [Sporolactobacillus inulinus]GAY78685.1 hypothetical protein NBRC111894_4239 [Sporolactobacillus inulinus]